MKIFLSISLLKWTHILIENVKPTLNCLLGEKFILAGVKVNRTPQGCNQTNQKYTKILLIRECDQRIEKICLKILKLNNWKRKLSKSLHQYSRSIKTIDQQINMAYMLCSSRSGWFGNGQQILLNLKGYNDKLWSITSYQVCLCSVHSPYRKQLMAWLIVWKFRVITYINNVIECNVIVQERH